MLIPNSQEFKLVRDITGVSFFDLKQTSLFLNEDNLLFCACYFYISTLAVNVKSDRHEYNLKRAKEKYTEILDQNIDAFSQLPNFLEYFSFDLTF